ncbi:hypothetical protein B0H17DRAFT_1185040 [Mycena rosella]|uniref:Zn(2)-C6 fungal-type domain-containing protein n=1 Tax=Mycena rosella TaxID=1033263 RepID=A0AAD7CTW2_MYCRO|nr:hypothetical protein B0H17DRAFT_1185040 [Mycena rosella]
MAHLANPVPPPVLPSVFTKKRRVIIACTNCRGRKVRCLTSEDPPQNPCQRCAKKGLSCEYITVTKQRDHSSSRNPTPEPGQEGAHWAPPGPGHFTHFTPPHTACRRIHAMKVDLLSGAEFQPTPNRVAFGEDPERLGAVWISPANELWSVPSGLLHVQLEALLNIRIDISPAASRRFQ